MCISFSYINSQLFHSVVSCCGSALQPIGPAARRLSGRSVIQLFIIILPKCIWNHSVPYLNITDRETRLQLLCQILKLYLKASENPEWWLSVLVSVIHISTHLSTKRCLKNPSTLWLNNLWMASEGVSRWAVCCVTCLLSGNNPGGLQELTDELYDKNLSYKMFLLSVSSDDDHPTLRTDGLLPNCRSPLGQEKETNVMLILNFSVYIPNSHPKKVHSFTFCFHMLINECI